MYQNPEVSFSPRWVIWNCFPLISRGIPLEVAHSGDTSTELVVPIKFSAPAASARCCSDTRCSFFFSRAVCRKIEDMAFLIFAVRASFLPLFAPPSPRKGYMKGRTVGGCVSGTTWFTRLGYLRLSPPLSRAGFRAEPVRAVQPSAVRDFFLLSAQICSIFFCVVLLGHREAPQPQEREREEGQQ